MDVRRIVIGGIVASLVLAMWEMVVEAVIPGGAGFFGAPVAIGATLVRDLQGSTNPLPVDAVALVLGLMGHMMNSVILAALFGLYARRSSRSTSSLVGIGAAWGVAIYVGMWYVVLPVIDPVMLNLNGPLFLAGHLMWGAALGYLWSRAARPVAITA